MTSELPGVARKIVGDMLIASIRFRGSYEEVPPRLEALYAQVEPYVEGNAMLLHHYYDQSFEDGQDLEVCYPVRQAVETAEVKSRILEGDDMLCAVHVGPRGPAGAEGSVTDTRRELWEYLRRENIIPGSGPRREVYLEGAQEHGGDAGRYVTEVQLPYRFHRMERIQEHLERFAGEAIRKQVMQGSEEYPSLSTRERGQWFQGAMERLDAALDDEGARRAIMNDCGERFPAHRIQSLRAEYQRSGSVDQLLEIMRADRTLGDLSWYEQPVREGDIIRVTKDPFLPQEYKEATDPAEKRAAYCHCGLMRDLIRSGKTMSETYCYCGAGWYKQLWEGILDQPVQIDVLSSVLQGDDDCTFAIHLPDESMHLPGEGIRSPLKGED